MEVPVVQINHSDWHKETNNRITIRTCYGSGVFSMFSLSDAKALIPQLTSACKFIEEEEKKEKEEKKEAKNFYKKLGEALGFLD